MAGPNWTQVLQHSVAEGTCTHYLLPTGQIVFELTPVALNWQQHPGFTGWGWKP